VTEWKNDIVRICELTVTTDVVSDATFDNVQLIGPAVVAFQGCSLENSVFEGDPEAFLWEVPADRQRVLGAVLFLNCRFTRCRFSRIGIAGPKEALDPIREALRVPGSP
jgi:hypothetical protein